MFVVTTDQIFDKKIIEVKGLVQGSTVQSKHLGRDIGASFKGLVGGEIRGYSELMQEAREVAFNRMIEQATALGANAIVGMRYQTAEVMSGAAEVIAYGTAVITN